MIINTIKIISFIFFAATMQGCLVFHTVSYEINLADEKSGTVTLEVSDIRSDAMNSSELEEDKTQLFDFILKSEDFSEQMKTEGKNISERELFLAAGRLNGRVIYSFEDISRVEGIVYEEPFYFLTLGLEDSIISTNGEVIASPEYKRIMWDKSINPLKFKMFSVDVEAGSLTEMSQFYLEE